MDFKINSMCFLTDPCQHYVKFNDGNNKRMSGPEIYNLYKEHDIDVPEHFLEYRSLAKVLKKKLSIDNGNADYAKLDNDNLGQYLLTACQNKNMDLARYLVDVRNTPVTIQIIKACCNNLDMLKWIIQKKGNLDINKIHYIFGVPNKFRYSGGCRILEDVLYANKGKNILSYMVHNNNTAGLKYLIEEVGISLSLGTKYSKPLIVALINDNKELVDYLIQKSIEQKAMFHGTDIYYLKKFEFYNIFKKIGLIFNVNIKCKCEIDIRERVIKIDKDNEMSDEKSLKDQKDIFEENVTKDLYGICNNPLPKSGQIQLKLEGWTNRHEFDYLDIIITIKTLTPDMINHVNYNCGGSLLPFEKICDGVFRLPKLSNPIHTTCLVWHDQRVDIDFDKNMAIKEFNVKFVLLKPKCDRKECARTHLLFYKLTDEYFMRSGSGMGSIQKINDKLSDDYLKDMIKRDPNCEKYLL